MRFILCKTALHRTKVRAFLDENFTNVWIGTRVSIDWAPRSPDLNPMDFFLWGTMKDRVYAENPKTMQQLRNSITQQFNEINNNKALCDKVCRSAFSRLECCIDSYGGHFEQFL